MFQTWAQNHLLKVKADLNLRTHKYCKKVTLKTNKVSIGAGKMGTEGLLHGLVDTIAKNKAPCGVHQRKKHMV